MAPNTKTGSLTIAGSGIASIAHITLETLSHIQEADRVYYVVADPATEAFIQDKSKGQCFDLTIYYDKDKMRSETYVQMSEVMLRDVRSGCNVLGIFYGHPGVFVSPSHRAISIARSEGFAAKMLPGVSAEDYLFSDLGFDPAAPGCMTQEATSLLIYNKKLDPSVHNIIWQVGAVGVHNTDFDNRLFHLLVDVLERDFGSEHKVIHYIGAIMPQSATTKDEFLVRELKKEDVIKNFTTTSTLYVPPRDIVVSVDAEVAQALGFVSNKALSQVERVTACTSATNAYGEAEQVAIGKLDYHVPPDSHEVLNASPAIRRFMEDLALKPSLLARYKEDPSAVINATQSSFTPEEKSALSLNEAGPVIKVMRAPRAMTANGREHSGSLHISPDIPSKVPGSPSCCFLTPSGVFSPLLGISPPILDVSSPNFVAKPANFVASLA